MSTEQASGWANVKKAAFLTLVLAVLTVFHDAALATGQRYNRPIPLGVCGSSIKADSCNGLCEGGTLGSTVKDSSGTQYILSNNHVIGRSNGAQPGDAVTQPDCTGKTSDTVAKFTRFVPLLGGGQDNYVDAAVAKVVSGKVSTNDNILNIGPVSDTLGCFVSAAVQKQGCITGQTAGTIFGCFAMIGTDDPCLGHLFYIQQIDVVNRSPIQQGDSGALLVSQGSNPKAFGLIFGSIPSGQESYAGWIGNVLQLTGMSGMATPTGAAAPAQQPTPAPTALDVEDQKAGQVVALFGPDIMKIPGVWGVEDHLKPDGHIEIRVDVEQITPEIQSGIPLTLGTSPSFPVEIFVSPPPVEDFSWGAILPRSGAEDNATQVSQPAQVSLPRVRLTRDG
jgi:hypothetical protein